MKQWINFSEKQPIDGQNIIARFKHGIIQCLYNKDDEVGEAYIWETKEFYIYEWIPIEKFNEWADGE